MLFDRDLGGNEWSFRENLGKEGKKKNAEFLPRRRRRERRRTRKCVIPNVSKLHRFLRAFLVERWFGGSGTCWVLVRYLMHHSGLRDKPSLLEVPPLLGIGIIIFRAKQNAPAWPKEEIIDDDHRQGQAGSNHSDATLPHSWGGWYVLVFYRSFLLSELRSDLPQIIDLHDLIFIPACFSYRVSTL